MAAARDPCETQSYVGHSDDVSGILIAKSVNVEL